MADESKTGSSEPKGSQESNKFTSPERRTVSASSSPSGSGAKVRESSSVVIDIEVDDGERTVVPDSGSDNTDFEDDNARSLDANVEDANENNGGPMQESSLSDPEEDNLFTGAGVTASQAELKEVQEKMLSVEERNREAFRNLKRFESTDRIFPDVRSSNFHTVAVTLTDDFKPGDSLAPYPATFTPKWHDDYVPLPCCPENIRVFQRQGNPPTEGRIILWDRIESALRAPFKTCEDIADAMRTYCRLNHRLTVLEYTLNTLMSHEERTTFFNKTLPGMVNLCLDLPKIVTGGLPFLSRFMNYSVTLSQKQIACLLANAFFSTFPNRFNFEDDFPSINFIGLLTGNGDDDRFSSMGNKLRCILHYFERVIDDMPKGVVTYTRKSVRAKNSPEWHKSDKELSQLITLHEGTIESDGERMLQIDFANKFVGGGVLRRGCVQEEILFVIYPELLISRLFTERLESCEALVITGSERFSKYKGYASDFEFDGDFIDCVPWNARGRKCTQIVAIDAQRVVKHTEQFHPRKLLREVNKAFIGFSNPPGSNMKVPVATGKWGCGAFKGDVYLKTILQLLAASQAGRQLVLFTFGDMFLQKEAEEIYEKIKHLKIREVWILLEQYNKLFCSNQKPSLNIYEFFTEYAQTSSFTPKDTINMETDPVDSGAEPIGRASENVISQSKISVQSPKESKPSEWTSWLRKLDNTKSQWKKPGNDTVTPNFDFGDSCGKQNLSDDQITALLNDPVSMDIEFPDLAPSASSTSGGNQAGTSIRKETKDDTGTKSPVFSKRSVVAGAGSNNSSGIPKQKRQMTLADFYKPITKK